MAQNEMHMNFSALSQNEGFARMVAGSFAMQLNPTIEELSDIRTAVSEAVTNAIIHGYESKQGMVFMDCYIDNNSFMAIIRDEGVGIEDISLARQPFYTSKPELERSGMGFTVMEAFMDSVEVMSRPGAGTTVTLKKTLGSDRVKANE
jgi:stage II sporulation protein AB (anti-sigma F factor)